MTTSDDGQDAELERGRYHVCNSCEWVGDGHDAEGSIVDGLPVFVCPECGDKTHREYFGNPIPEEGTTWKTPVGLDECPACATPGVFVDEETGTCLCGAQLGGLSKTELVSAPDRGEKDVIIRASEDDLRHKVFDYTDGKDLGDNPRRSLAYWRVNGTPRQTGPGRTIMFSTDGETVDYHAPICTAEDGKLWFAFLYPTQYDVPVDPPTRGFRYFEWRDYRW